ncbi:hypothetical protein WR25_27072 [Diploscapter pachys]|uniref:C2H2-type domain-containing protein n=1 Tax=Diploscapter pachys TaxID=2018661 RepID=A0A2A2KD04_9BILA|nr:hypothetical protein WR25_27072 [Diploscapter pachys]
MDFLSTGILDMQSCSKQALKNVADIYQIRPLQEALQPELQDLPRPQPQKPVMSLLQNLNPQLPIMPFSIAPLLFNPQYLQILAQQITQMNLLNTPENNEAVCKMKRDKEMKKSTSLDCDDSAPFDNMGDVIIPSNDKEGWCRNKKYIEKTENGFMCTVCRKIYGRYNSVSYHVTIYHRNPPIRCDLPGCQFTTREARYIHFHKYYRHGVPLPQSIDQGTRRCPHCRHVSKSPAMLEKHIKRHQLNLGSSVDSSSTSDHIIVDEEFEQRDRTFSQSNNSELMEEDEIAEEEEVKLRSNTL